MVLSNYNVPILSIILSNYNVHLCPCGVPIKITICPFEHIFIKFGTGKFSQEIVKPFQFWLKLNEHNGCFAGRHAFLCASPVYIGFLIVPCDIQ